MALKKTVVMPNGIPLEYHRIAQVRMDTNQQNTVLVHSYLNEATRQYEKDYAAGTLDPSEMARPTFPYVHAQYYNPDYSGAMSISGAYEWLKANVPAFEGAEDTGDVADEISGDEFITLLEEVL